MTPRRWGSVLLLITLVWTSIPAAAQEGQPGLLSVREIIDRSRAAQAVVMVELEGGTVISGRIGRTNGALFYVMDGVTPRGHAVPYANLRALIDPTTGERLDLQVPRPMAHLPKVDTSLKAWLIAGVV